MKKVRIIVEGITLVGELGNTETAQKVWDALPFESIINTWGDEIYFNIPVETDQESGARADVETGDMGYWPPGKAFCVFYGPTPASTDDKPHAASPVNVFGRIEGDPTVLRSVRDGSTVTVERLEDI